MILNNAGTYRKNSFPLHKSEEIEKQGQVDGVSGVGFVTGIDLRGLVHINDQCFIHLCAKA